MRTSDPDIFALGECAEAHGQVFGLVAPLYEMAGVIAAQLAGDSTAAFKPSATATKLKVTGINLFSAGDFAEAEDREEIVLRDAARGVYKRLVLKDNKHHRRGAVRRHRRRRLVLRSDQEAAPTSREMRDTLIFGQAYAGGRPAGPYGGRCSLAG